MKQPWYKKIWETPWMRNTSIGAGVVLLTVIAFVGQQYAEWLGASLVGVPSCVQDSGKIVTFPVAGVADSLSKADITQAIQDRKISTLHGKYYSTTTSQLATFFNKITGATSGQELNTVQTEEYQSGGHIGIDVPVWWHDDKENVPIVSPFTQAEVYRTFSVDEGSNTWGNGVTLCYSNEHGTYFAHFAHLRDKPLLTEGQIISNGEQIGHVGDTGNSHGAHLHFQVNKYARYNPYYTSDPIVMKSTFIDPLLLATNTTLAYGGNVLVAGPEPTENNTTTSDLLSASIMNLSLTPTKNSAEVGEKVKITVDAKDKDGNPASGKILITSSVPIGLPAEKELSDGSGELEITSSSAQDIKLTITNKNGDVSKNVTISFKTTETEKDTEVSNKVKDIFTDISSISSPEESAIQYLWDNKITTGCSADKFCPNDNLNRAAAATFLIRAFYPQIDLNSVAIGSMPFSDVEVSDWYAAPVYIANLANYNGVTKPVIIKGSDGRAMPASNVKLEEFSAMILRVLNVEVTETEAWYEGYLTKMNQLGLISQSESTGYLGKSISRKMVARILHQATIWYQSNPNGLALTEAEKKANEVVEVPQKLEAANNGIQVVLQWQNSSSGNIGYNIYRKIEDGGYELIGEKVTDLIFGDPGIVTGKTFTYKVETVSLTSGKTSEASEEVSIQI